MKKNFSVEVYIRKITKESGLVIIYCNRPRALGEILRYKYHIPRWSITVWGHGVTLFPEHFQLMKGEFEGVEIPSSEE